MTAFVALLRAVNVGGTGMLPMAELRAMGEACGFASVRTHIASGNLLFESALEETAVRGLLEERLGRRTGKPAGVLVRTGAELAAVLAANPFAGAPPNRVTAIFLPGPPAADALAGATGVAGERMALGTCEIYVNYGDGMAQSRLRIPAAAAGTARNMNTVARLAALSGA